MKRNLTLFLIAILLIAATTLLYIRRPGAEATATLSIEAEGHFILSSETITFRKGETILDILKTATRERRIHMDYTGVRQTAYVRGIDNRYEFDAGPASGWVYYINGIRVTTGAGMYRPAQGDTIEWRFITE
jgi:hypothetical protein